MASIPCTEADENRFTALLNPIRDITASWGVDVAKELTDYALSLGFDISDEQAHSQTQPHPFAPVDFAKAALLVQGSTSIYSRKVEHLYNLVYVAVSSFDHMQGKKPPSNGNADSALNDADADALLQLDDIDFLTLDDIVPNADPKSITLPDKRNERAQASLHDETRLLPVPPMLVLRTTDASQRIGGVEFKVLSSHTHHSGALIMPGCPPINEDLTTLPPQTDPAAANIEAVQPFDDNADDFDDGAVDDFAPQSPIGGVDISDTEPHPAVESDDPVSASQVIMQTAARYGYISPKVDNQAKEKKDPFLMLDPHEEAPHLNKPMRVGKTYKKPRKGPMDVELVPSPWIRSAGVTLFDTALGKIHHKGPIKRYVSFPALQPACAVVLRKRQAARRRRIMLAREQEVLDVGVSADLVHFDEEEEPDIDRNIEDEALDFDHDDCDDFEPLEHPCIENEFDGVRQVDAADLLNDAEEQLGNEFARIASSFEETCRKHLQRTAWMWEQQSTDVELVRRVEEWRSRIQPLLDQEESRKEFDISRYGDGIIKVLQEKVQGTRSEQANVSELLAQTSKFEVCRQFLATLQLANHYRLEILPPAECCVSDFKVKILDAGKGKDTSADDKVQPSKARSTKRLRSPSSKQNRAKRQALRPRVMNEM